MRSEGNTLFYFIFETMPRFGACRGVGSPETQLLEIRVVCPQKGTTTAVCVCFFLLGSG